MKKNYQSPFIEIVKLDSHDVILMSETSGDVEYCELFGDCETPAS